MKQQTAVEWLHNQWANEKEWSWEKIESWFKQAKQMEKEQIQKAFSDGQETPINHPTLPHYSREEYYNDTYKTT